MEGPIPLLVLTQYIDESPRIEAEEADYLRSPKSEHSFGGIEHATWTKRQNNEEGDIDVQAKKKENIHVKYLSPSHSMHYTNSVGRINGRMASEPSQLAIHSTTSSKTLMGQTSKGRSVVVQVEGYDAI